jgi:hypothetical protein
MTDKEYDKELSFVNKNDHVNERVPRRRRIGGLPQSADIGADALDAGRVRPLSHVVTIRRQG